VAEGAGAGAASRSPHNFDVASFAKAMNVGQRRVYDLIEIFTALGMTRPDTYTTFTWVGPAALLKALGRYQEAAIYRHPEEAQRHGLIDGNTAAALLHLPSAARSFALSPVELAMEAQAARGEAKKSGTTVIVNCCVSLFLLGRTEWTTDEMIAQLFPVDLTEAANAAAAHPAAAAAGHVRQPLAGPGDAALPVAGGARKLPPPEELEERTIKTGRKAGTTYRRVSKSKLATGEQFSFYGAGHSICAKVCIVHMCVCMCVYSAHFSDNSHIFPLPRTHVSVLSFRPAKSPFPAASSRPWTSK